MKINILLVVGFIIIVVFIVWFFYKRESFSVEFDTTTTSSQFFQYVDMGDHATLVQLQKGNNGDTVLLLHNSPMNSNIWNILFQTMQRFNMSGKKTPNLVSYDLRGHGTAWMPVATKYNDDNIDNMSWTAEQYIEDCKRIYDQVICSKGTERSTERSTGRGTGCGEPIILCGFGFGGFIAQKFALKYPMLIKELVILQTSIRPPLALQSEIDYLAGQRGWIAKNPHVTYLTPEETFVQQLLCEWFYLPNTVCARDHLDNRDLDDRDLDNRDAPQYNLTAEMVRQGSSTTTLQIDKLQLNIDLTDEWKNAGKLPFTIHILAASDDPYATPNDMTNTYTDIYNVNRDLQVVFDIVDGRHGFTIMKPEYIARILCKDCR